MQPVCKKIIRKFVVMKTDAIEKILKEHGVHPTAVRILIYRSIECMDHTFSLGDVENALISVDKSTIFRTLQLFAEKHLLHVVDDGSGSKKYCVCRNQHPCRLSETHCHFRCEICQTTYCLPQTYIPEAALPDGFVVRRAEMLFVGICPSCSRT